MCLPFSALGDEGVRGACVSVQEEEEGWGSRFRLQFSVPCWLGERHGAVIKDRGRRMFVRCSVLISVSSTRRWC